MSNLNGLIYRLATHEVEFVLVGGYAAIVHGGTNVTEDVDVCLGFCPDNLSRLWNVVSDLHPVHRLTPQKLPLKFDQLMSGEWKNLYLLTDWGVLDCLGEVMGVGNYDAVKAHSVGLLVDGQIWQVLDLPTLIQAKVAMGRPHDKITAIQLQAILESQGK
jgi:hypothetical protein